jgi:hypothetical protein
MDKREEGRSGALLPVITTPYLYRLHQVFGVLTVVKLYSAKNYRYKFNKGFILLEHFVYIIILILLNFAT